MTQPLETFFAAWSEADAKARGALIASAMSGDATYADPRAQEPVTGLDALNDYVGMFSANAPGWSATVLKSDSIAGVTRATVAFGGKGPDGLDMVQMGQYFVEIGKDGLISRMIGFAGTGAPE